MIILKANKVPDHVAIVSNMIANLQVINHPQRVCVSVLCCDIRLYRYCRFLADRTNWRSCLCYNVASRRLSVTYVLWLNGAS